MRIAVFGDSIVWGEGDTSIGGWVTLLRNWCEENREDIEVYNLGISGDTSEDLLARVDGEARVRGPDIIVFSVGVNDTLYRGEATNTVVPLEKFRKNITALFEKALAQSKHVFALGIGSVDESETMPWESDGSSYNNANLRAYDTEVETVARAHGVGYISLLGCLTSEDLADGLHPNSQGHQKIFTLVKDTLISHNII